MVVGREGGKTKEDMLKQDVLMGQDLLRVFGFMRKKFLFHPKGALHSIVSRGRRPARSNAIRHWKRGGLHGVGTVANAGDHAPAKIVEMERFLQRFLGWCGG